LRGPVAAFARQVIQNPGDLEAHRGVYAEQSLVAGAAAAVGAMDKKVLDDARSKKAAYDSAREALTAKRQEAVQAGKLGVDLSVQTRCLRNQSRLEQSAVRNVLGRSLLEIAGVWIDERFDAKMPALAVKAQSDAYFRILERHPSVKDLYSLGNRSVWVTPCGTALIIDTGEGKEALSDAEIDHLFSSR
jgi:Ca-activated chloride channel family protein